jgi:hypothetical protein
VVGGGIDLDTSSAGNLKLSCIMVTLLQADTPTEREWNFRDDNDQHFHGDIPEDQPVVLLTLNWKAGC